MRKLLFGIVALFLSLCLVGCCCSGLFDRSGTEDDEYTNNETEYTESEKDTFTDGESVNVPESPTMSELQTESGGSETQPDTESETPTDTESETPGSAESEIQTECETHAFGVWTVVKLPSCTEEGRRERTCACGEIEYEIFEKTDHQYGEWLPIGSTVCAETVSYRRSCTCGAFETKTEKGPGHTEKVIYGKMPTDTHAGYTERVVCEVCGCVIKESIDVPVITAQEVDILSSVTYEGNSNGILTFHWNVAPEYEGTLLGMNISVSNGTKTNNYQVFDYEETWQFESLGNLVRFEFSFTPITVEGVQGNAFETTFFWFPETYTTPFPKIEINTLNGELPTFEKTSPPPGCWGGGITNANYVQSTVSLYDENNTLLYTSISSGYEGAKIKVRGNTSAYASKQPFKIRLKREFDLLGGLIEREDGKDYKNRDWLLLKGGNMANIAVGSEISELVGNEWTPQYCYVMLFVNGEYRGLYVLMESVDTAEARCNVSDSGYIVEMDAYWWNEPLYFTTPLCENRPAKLTFKYPDSDDISESSPEYKYIKQYITDYENVLFGNTDGNINDYIDLESFVKWQMTHDILASYDSGGSNMYITKYDNTSGSKLKAGPVWDYDSIYWSNAKFKVDTFARIRYEEHFYTYFLAQNPEFQSIYRARYNEIRNSIVPTVESAFTQFDNDTYRRLLALEKSRWGGSQDDPAQMRDRVSSWMTEHLSWMDENID